MQSLMHRLMERFKGLSSMVAGFRPEKIFMVWLLSFAALYLRNRIRRILRQRKAEDGQQRLENVVAGGEKDTVVVRGKTFTLVANAEDDDGVDLGWSGTMQYWIPVLVFGIEAVQISILGEKAFKLRGYTPIQRGVIQVILFFGLLPILDLAMGDDWTNPTKAQIKDRRLANRFRLPLYTWCAVEALGTLSIYNLVFSTTSKLSRGNRLALLATLALFNGAFGITISHELLHKQSVFEKSLGYFLLTNVNYVHWGEEHLSGHHETVATPEDPATSRRGETLYAFLPRTFVGGLMSSCKLEEQRLRLEQNVPAGQPVNWYVPNNRIFLGFGASALWAAFLAKYVAKDWRAVPVFYVQGAVSALLLEVINYVEHYGLERRKLADGSYEPVTPVHSWNAPNRLSNAILYKLQRHSDHHTFASRPYEILRNCAESPQLPTGYPGCFVMAFVPPVWFNIMDDLLKAHHLEYHGDRAATAEEMTLAASLKTHAKVKTWMFSVLGLGAVSTAVMRMVRN